MTHTLPWIDVLGFWIGIFLTFAILSYLYKDNPFYKAAEHLFVGVSIGYVITQQYYNVIKPNLVDRLAPERWTDVFRPSLYWIPLVLVVLLFARLISRRLAWVSRYPIAFVVALYAGIQINAVAQADLAEQITVSTRSPIVSRIDVNDAATTVRELAGLPGFTPAVAQKVIEARAAGVKVQALEDLTRTPGLTDAQRQDLHDALGGFHGLGAQAAVGPGRLDGFAIASRIFLLVGLVASLVYFYFSAPQRGALGKVARFGVYILMIGFGASFGSTVQGRLALAVGRAMDVLGKDKSPELAAQIHGPVVSVVSILLIVAGIAIWERVYLPRRGPDAPPPDDDLPAY